MKKVLGKIAIPEEIQEILNNVAIVTNKIPPPTMLDDISSLRTVNAYNTGYGMYVTFLADLLFYRESGNSLNTDHPPNTLLYDKLAQYCKN